MTEHNHATDIEKAMHILKQAEERLEEELTEMGFSVSSRVYQGDDAPYTSTMYFSASLKWTNEGIYTLVPPKPKTFVPCEDNGHTWVEYEDDDTGEPYDQCLTCSKVVWL